MFKQLIVKKTGRSYLNGLTTSDLGEPDYTKLLSQHDAYIEALEMCDVAIKILPKSEEFPDSTFVEDTAVLTSEFAVITNPGADSRNGEIKEMEHVLKEFYTDIRYINAPGTLDGGDVLQIDKHFYIGISDRTNEDGANQLKRIVESSGYQATIVPLKKFFHLKSGVSYLGDNLIIAAGEFVDHPDFVQYEKIVVPPEEEYSANCIRVNDFVIFPKGFEKTKKQINDAGYRTIEVDMTEFQKHDGGLSCLSLRF
ncbi:dimethylarginine dimethylaminohydrolase family protein [Virgibacillus necropolis]|uniref:N(G),N(G)-dimethylarginine dimethylaminohydrolase n=1 Tax=Virgibacillus necropolis TaxID=163877 RepID=A0A221MEP7_9BACI|nr:arginine deiminase family protein [Virgibacillus necropolis]ASN06143.1 N(G),N(G)-dimethylarginine dimethylaminohydrolase [Virgibacillus necropolis]